MSNLSPHQFANVQDLVWKHDKTDVDPTPMDGIRDSAHSRGRDWHDLIENRWDHTPDHTEAMYNDVRRRGVREPIGIDRSTTPPTISDGHTRLMAAYAAGLRRVPVRDLPIGQAENKHVERT